MEDKEEMRGELVVYVFWFSRVSFLCRFYGGGSQRVEEGSTRWSTGGERFSVARCPPYSTCTTSPWPVFDSLHFRTACSLNILTCFRRNSAHLTFLTFVLNHWSAELAKRSWLHLVIVPFLGVFFFMLAPTFIRRGCWKSWFWSFHTSNFSSDPTSHWAQLTACLDCAFIILFNCLFMDLPFLSLEWDWFLFVCLFVFWCHISCPPCSFDTASHHIFGSWVFYAGFETLVKWGYRKKTFQTVYFWCGHAYTQSHNMDQAALRLHGAFEEKSDKICRADPKAV